MNRMSQFGFGTVAHETCENISRSRGVLLFFSCWKYRQSITIVKQTKSINRRAQLESCSKKAIKKTISKPTRTKQTNGKRKKTERLSTTKTKQQHLVVHGEWVHFKNSKRELWRRRHSNKRFERVVECAICDFSRLVGFLWMLKLSCTVIVSYYLFDKVHAFRYLRNLQFERCAGLGALTPIPMFLFALQFHST